MEPPQADNNKDGVSETVPEVSSNIAETSDAIEIEESQRDEAIIAWRDFEKYKSIQRNRIVKATHHVDFLKECVEAGKVPRGLRILTASPLDEFSQLHQDECYPGGHT